MILLGKPYVSDFLVKTIRENNFPVIATKHAREMVQEENLNWISEEDAVAQIMKNKGSVIYSNSENNIQWLQENASGSSLPGQIALFKNKIRFRELIMASFPDYFFKGVKYADLRDIDPENLKFPFIIKPSVGFSSIAVHKVDNSLEWHQVLDDIEIEIEDAQDMFPKEVIELTEFIIEEYIDGEEYAVDCYFDKEGEPVILNILHHIFSSDKDVSDRVYYTSPEIIEKHKDKVQDFLQMVGRKALLKNFPAHLELRITKEGRINPIEVNPLRFGGFCTTGDLSFYAYGINSYEYFFNSKKPDWDKILLTRRGKQFNLIALDNNSGIKVKEIESFDYEALLKNFEKPLDLRKINYKVYPLFGMLFTETVVGKNEEIDRILHSNLREYIKVKGELVNATDF